MPNGTAPAANLNMSLPATVRLPNLRLPRGDGEAQCLSEQARAAQDVISDETLMSLICQGDQEALASLFRRHARVVRRVALRILKDASEAEDLLQDIFVLIHRLCRTFDNSKAPALSHHVAHGQSAGVLPPGQLPSDEVILRAILPIAAALQVEPPVDPQSGDYFPGRKL